MEAKAHSALDRSPHPAEDRRSLPQDQGAAAVPGRRSKETLARCLEALQAVYSNAAKSGCSYESLCDEVVSALAKLLRASSVYIQHVEGNGARVISRFPDGYLSQGETVFPSEFSSAPALNRPCRTTFSGSTKSRISAPIPGLDGKPVAFICATDKEGRIFSRDDLWTLEVFSRQLSYESERAAAEKRLRHKDKITLLGQLAAGIAHEVRNPLNAILAVAEALFQDIRDLGQDPDHYKPFLEHIRTQVDRLSGLMGDLLDLGKPVQTSGFVAESLPQICLSAISLWEKTPVSRGHKVVLAVPRREITPYVKADRSRLCQAIFNVLDNASRHGPEGSEIRVVICEPKRGAVHVQITDHGPGVSVKDLARVFEPFFTTRKKGTGLGLSLVKHVIQAHGGEVSIWNNNPPPGCTVQITLPLFQERENDT